LYSDFARAKQIGAHKSNQSECWHVLRKSIAYFVKIFHEERVFDVELAHYLRLLDAKLLVPQQRDGHLERQPFFPVIHGACVHTDARYCLLLEKIQGTDLAARLNGPAGVLLHPVTVLGLAYHVAAALTQLHGLDPPVAHRDVKPANIMLDESMGSEQARLLDLGCSKRASGRATQTGGVGTPAYLSPEVADGSDVSDAGALACDVFSYGLVLFELITSQLAYVPGTGSTLSDEIRHSLLGQRCDAASSSPHLKELAELAMKCATQEPERRPRFVRSALQQNAGELTIVERLKLIGKDFPDLGFYTT
jgi:serine/threonine protein kinase